MILKTALDFHCLYLKKLIASTCVKTSMTVWWCTMGCVTELVLYFQLSIKALVKTEIVIIHLVESPLFSCALQQDIGRTQPACNTRTLMFNNTWSSTYKEKKKQNLSFRVHNKDQKKTEIVQSNWGGASRYSSLEPQSLAYWFDRPVAVCRLAKYCYLRL